MADPKMAGSKPLPTELNAGETYYWCQCGQSQNQPFCDGSHKGSGFNPVPYTPEETATAYMCMCKRTGNAPLCDGTHASLKS
jgi:CDGSH-type Zn-finger protein